MDQMMNDGEYLIHYGVLGMKWGVRKAGGSSGSSRSISSSKKKTLVSKIKKKVRQIKSDRAYVKNQRRKIKNISKRRYSMSDQELNKHINRLEKQKKLKDLSSSEVNPGRAAANRTLKKYGGKSAGIVVATATGYALRKYLR